uniref:Uncharacterized protein n=1 Tax=Romanomermis culicivorax TaxID=13658 RepID=A0A915K1S6_ROMCU
MHSTHKRWRKTGQQKVEEKFFVRTLGAKVTDAEAGAYLHGSHLPREAFLDIGIWLIWCEEIGLLIPKLHLGPIGAPGGIENVKENGSGGGLLDDVLGLVVKFSFSVLASGSEKSIKGVGLPS